MSSLQAAGATSDVVRVRVPAKINLALQVGGLRDDGFHELSTVFQAVSLYDEVGAVARPDDSITSAVKGEGAEAIGLGMDNLAVRAAHLLRERFGSPDLGVHLKIKKSIPVAGGMAGGSADAAGALLACSVLWDLDTSPNDLLDLAAELGSDVPFSLVGGTAIGRGRGDALVPLLSRGSYHWALAIAERGLSTPVVFNRLDELTAEGHTSPCPEKERTVLNSLASADVAKLARCMCNDLQPASLDLYPELATILSVGLHAGALGALISGSGPTCAFLCASESDAVAVARRLEGVPQVRATKRAVGPVPGAQLVN